MHDSAFDTLRALACLGNVSDEGVRWLAGHVAPAVFEAGERLITEGDTSRECYFIVSGDTEVTAHGRVLGISGAGEPEGEVALFLYSPRVASTTARTKVECLVLQASDFDALRASNTELADHIRVEMCRHLARRFGLPGFAGVPIE